MPRLHPSSLWRTHRLRLSVRIGILLLATLFSLVSLPWNLVLAVVVLALLPLYLTPRLLRGTPLPPSHPLSLAAATLAEKASLPPPLVFLTHPTSRPTASISSAPFTRPRLRLSPSAAALPPEEISAIIAHELGHVSSRDSLDQLVWAPAFFAALRWGVTTCSTFTTLSRHYSVHRDSLALFHATLFALLSLVGLVAPVLALLALTLAHSRSRELCADRYATGLVSPALLLTALRSITPARSFSPTRFDSHPSLAERAALLEPEITES